MILYLHGFNSSPQSFKARLLHDYLVKLGRAAEFEAPVLPFSPAMASARLREIVRRRPVAAVVGSSLGGYYATWLAQEYGVRAVLVNPAVRPYDSLKDHVGRHRNFHTGEEYDFTVEHIAELQALEIDVITPAHFLLLVGTADEVLDYHDALMRYRGCRQIIVHNANHGLDSFGDYLDVVIAFCDANRQDARV